MRLIPRVACINDISGFGRCSLTTALPVLSVMGVQPCPAPTSVFSKHTGFPTFYYTDLTDTMPGFLENWSDLAFDWIYCGFFSATEQIAIVRDFVHRAKQQNPACRFLLDPVMGDHGKRYSTCTEALCSALRALVSEADVITPNITEACLLTDTVYCGESPDQKDAAALAKSLMQLGCGAAVLTGIAQNDTVSCLIAEPDSLQYSDVQRTKTVFSGTGDLFASVLCGALARGESLLAAVTAAETFVADATHYTEQQHAPAQDGIVFEPLLGRLCIG